MKLFPATAPLESFVIVILSEFIRTRRGHKFILVITDRFTKLAKPVPMKEISTGEVAKIFVEPRGFNYGLLTELLYENGSQFTSKFFKDICCILNTENAFKKTYNPQKNGQAERLNRMIIASL